MNRENWYLKGFTPVAGSNAMGIDPALVEERVKMALEREKRRGNTDNIERIKSSYEKWQSEQQIKKAMPFVAGGAVLLLIALATKGKRKRR